MKLSLRELNNLELETLTNDQINTLIIENTDKKEYEFFAHRNNNKRIF